MNLETLARLDRRIPEWAVERAEIRPCPLCRLEREAVVRRPDLLPLAYCQDCGLWFVSSFPAQSAWDSHYEGYWVRTRPSDLSQSGAERLVQVSLAAARSDVRLQKLKALTESLSGLRLLDVGCGLGEFLIAAREEGVKAIGVDVSPEACRFARTLGLEIYEGFLQQCASSIAPVDLVVMSDLIEHPLEPGILLETTWNILKPGGRLMLWTPNGGAAGESAATAREWVGFRVDLEHMQYFSTRTISRLARRQGWHIEHLETLGHPDLQDIERLSAGPAGPPSSGWREALKKVPGAVFAVSRVRSFVKRAFPAPLPAYGRFDRDGSYHLFAILRRPDRGSSSDEAKL